MLMLVTAGDGYDPKLQHRFCGDSDVASCRTGWTLRFPAARYLLRSGNGYVLLLPVSPPMSHLRSPCLMTNN